VSTNDERLLTVGFLLAAGPFILVLLVILQRFVARLLPKGRPVFRAWLILGFAVLTAIGITLEWLWAVAALTIIIWLAFKFPNMRIFPVTQQSKSPGCRLPDSPFSSDVGEEPSADVSCESIDL
jgi:hypothetical protein